MAESKVFLNDPNSMDDISSVQNLTENVFNSSENIAQEMLIDNLLVEPPTNERDPLSIDNEPEKEAAKEACYSNEEQHVESPTTGEGYTFKCIYCDRVLAASDDPKLLECLHNACSSCITSKLYEQNDRMGQGLLGCPLCGIQCDSTHIIENQFLLELANNDEGASAKSADLKCSSCSDEAPATSYCADCSEFICDNCVQAHQRLKITKDHTIKSKEEGMNELNTISNGSPTNLFCAVHPHEKLSLFCETCDKLTCRDCQLIEHREHKYKFTNEIASEAKKYISEMLKDVGYKRALLTSAMKVIDDRQNLITDKKQALVKEITQLVMKLTSTINVRGKQLVAKLTEVCDSKQKTLQEKKIALEQLSKMTDHCIQFTQHALDNGSDMALLYSKKQVTDHLKRIKCKRADIPNPEIPVRIHLALDKVPDLIKVMSTIGQIVVDGRVYPSQATSPATAFPPSSPSPGHSRPPQQQSPMSPMHQQLPSPSSYQQLQQQQQQQQQQSRISNPPPYSQYQNNNQHYQHQQQQPQQQLLSSALGQNIQQQQQQQHHQQQQQQQGMGPGSSSQSHALQNITSMHQLAPRMQNMGPPSMNAIPNAIPISLAQQLSLNRLQRPPLTRAILPRMGSNSLGLNQQQQQVSSSTHPQGMMQDRSNLRHLLQPSTNNSSNPVYIQTGPAQYQAIQPHLAPQFQNSDTGHRYPGQQQIRFNPQQNQVRMMVSNQQNQQSRMVVQQRPAQQPQPQQQQQQQQQQLQQTQQQQFPAGVNNAGGSAKWHIPQQMGNAAGNNRNMTLPTINDNFKITLRQQQPEGNKNTPATVTSTIPKTPSPNHVQGRSDTERNLDKFCEDSVKDLMATIAKLDSNGVQVLAEGRQKGGSPHVDSSTGDANPAAKIKSELMESSKDDPNEDWCAVCMDGGELVCCDKCPKVFHQYCHIPNLSVEENDTWQCLLCMNFADIPESILGERKDGELSLKERKIAERLVLELYCQYDISLPFREIISTDNTEYHSIIKNPIALDTIRQKLNWNSSSHYRHMEELVRDVRLMFKNAYTFNPVDSQIYTDAKTLEKFFDEQLEKFLPEYAYENFEEDDESHPPSKKFRRIMTD